MNRTVAHLQRSETLSANRHECSSSIQPGITGLALYCKDRWRCTTNLALTGGEAEVPTQEGAGGN